MQKAETREQAMSVFFVAYPALFHDCSLISHEAFCLILTGEKEAKRNSHFMTSYALPSYN